MFDLMGSGLLGPGLLIGPWAGVWDLAWQSPTTGFAVLACLHLADKLRALERENQQLKQQGSSRSEAFQGLVEQLVSAVEEAAP